MSQLPPLVRIPEGLSIISSFGEENRFLSNFFYVVVNFDGVSYKTVEHAYQAAKTLDKNKRKDVQSLPTPGRAKRWGRSVELRPDWEEIKVSIMRDLIIEKFLKNPGLGDRLSETYPSFLIEGNTWNDTFWGAVGINNKWVGNNVLGYLLMGTRDILRGTKDIEWIAPAGFDKGELGGVKIIQPG